MFLGLELVGWGWWVVGWAGRFGVGGLRFVRIWGCGVGVGRTFVLAGMAWVGWGR